MQIPDYREWMKQPLVWTERIRSRALVWTPEAHWFINDPLGHLPHLHPAASEIVYIASGQMEVQVGAAKHRVGPGDLLFMPPDKYQDYWLIGDETVCLFVLVVPNVKHARWSYDNFPPEAFEGEGQPAHVLAGNPLPSDERIACHMHVLPAGDSRAFATEDRYEKMIYVLEGRARIAIERLSGEMEPNDYQHVPATHRHAVGNPGTTPLRFLEFVCFDPTVAAPLNHDAAGMRR